MRLIDADRLLRYAIAFFTGDYANISEFAKVSHIINIAPTVDAVPVIRCRECENWKPTGSRAARNIEDPLEQLGGCEIMCIGRLESDFCSCGKRKVKNNA